jgi:hypothetical protein
MLNRYILISAICVSALFFSALPALSRTLADNPDSIPFAPKVDYGVGDDPGPIFCADLDGDGDLDLAVVNYNSHTVSILKNNGDGTFQPKVDYGGISAPTSVFCADLDGDGDLDLAITNQNSYSVSILKNNGDGSFQPPVNYGVGYEPSSVFCADLDGDEDLDLTVANASFSDNVSILKNNGGGAFQPKVDYGSGDEPLSVFCADLDGDGDLDLATANYWSNDVSILKNNGDGTFQPKVDYTVGWYLTTFPWALFCADLDGDEDLDLAVASVGIDCVSIFKNNGDGTFQHLENYPTGTAPVSVFCADLDGDGDLDLAVVNFPNYVSILKNNGDGTFQVKVDYVVGDYPSSVFCADLDGDGDFDLAVANAESGNVSILKNLTQIPVNQPPHPFELLFPPHKAFTLLRVPFDWEIATDPNPFDQVKYDLYVSTSYDFLPEFTIIDSNLVVSRLTKTLDYGAYYWKVNAKDNLGAERWSNQTRSFIVTGMHYSLGDFNEDGFVDMADVVFLINYLYISGPAPDPLELGDINCDDVVNIADVIYIINYLFIGGPPPGC